MSGTATRSTNILDLRYGGTYSQFAHTFPAMGVTVKFFDCTKPEEVVHHMTLH
jgi:O-acetylhomoserine/O-acetylserine sulfhydrylase-like pyridoxal-dependent enzyme